MISTALSTPEWTGNTKSIQHLLVRWCSHDFYSIGRIIIYTCCVGIQRVKGLFVNELYSQPAVQTIAAKQKMSKVLANRVMFDAVLYIICIRSNGYMQILKTGNAYYDYYFFNLKKSSLEHFDHFVQGVPRQIFRFKLCVRTEILVLKACHENYSSSKSITWLLFCIDTS